MQQSRRLQRSLAASDDGHPFAGKHVHSFVLAAVGQPRRNHPLKLAGDAGRLSNSSGDHHTVHLPDLPVLKRQAEPRRIGADVEDEPTVHIRRHLRLDPYSVANELLTIQRGHQIQVMRLRVCVEREALLWIRDVTRVPCGSHHHSLRHLIRPKSHGLTEHLKIHLFSSEMGRCGDPVWTRPNNGYPSFFLRFHALSLQLLHSLL